MAAGGDAQCWWWAGALGWGWPWRGRRLREALGASWCADRAGAQRRKGSYEQERGGRRCTRSRATSRAASSARAQRARFIELFGVCHLLAAVAGVGPDSPANREEEGLTVEGEDAVYHASFLSHFLFLRMLLPTLINSGGRVLFVVGEQLGYRSVPDPENLSLREMPAPFSPYAAAKASHVHLRVRARPAPPLAARGPVHSRDCADKVSSPGWRAAARRRVYCLCGICRRVCRRRLWAGVVVAAADKARRESSAGLHVVEGERPLEEGPGGHHELRFGAGIVVDREQQVALWDRWSAHVELGTGSTVEVAESETVRVLGQRAKEEKKKRRKERREKAVPVATRDSADGAGNECRLM